MSHVFGMTVPAAATGRAMPGRLPEPRLRRLAWNALWLGATLVLLVPAARGYSTWLGWLPLWLLAMPLSALWAAHGFRVPRLPATPAPSRRPRRRAGGQARRRSQRPGAGHASRAA